MPPDEDIHYGPHIATERGLRLLGDLRNKRVVELGCGAYSGCIAFAALGAIAIGVDPSSEHLGEIRRTANEREIRLELRQGDLADLAFLRADSVDLVFAAYTLGDVEDLGRVFRQVHRVLRVGAPLVFSLPHPITRVIELHGDDPLRLSRSYFDPAPSPGDDGTRSYVLSELFTLLTRASYRVDAIVEPEATPGGPGDRDRSPALAYVPGTLVVRARKEGN